MKKTPILFFIFLLCSMVYAAAQEKVEVNGIFYNLDEPNAIVTYGGDHVTQRIPYTGDIVLPNSIKYKGKTYIVTSIGEKAFTDCINLTSITISSSVTSIGDMAFSFCKNLTSIILPNNITSIGKGAFASCSNLASVNIPDKVTKIDEGTFAFCSNLASITIPESVTSIEILAFSSCRNLKDIYLNNRKPLSIYVSDVFRSLDLSTCRLHVPKGTKEVYADRWPAFKTIIDDLSPITGSGVQKNIKVDGFYYELSGQNATVVRNMKYNAPNEPYSGNIKIPASFVFEGKTYHVTSIGYSAFYDYTGLISVTMPNSVTSIEENAFGGCTGLVSVNMPDMLQSIGQEAFAGCESLISITLPENLKTIGLGAFIGCKNLTTVTLPKNLKSIEDYTFADCTNLTSLTISRSVTSIGTRAFSDCKNLKDIYIKNSGSPRVDVRDAFYGVDFSTCSLHIPKDSKQFYSYGWNSFIKIIEDEVLGKIEVNGIYYELDGPYATVTYGITDSRDRIAYKGKIVIPKSIKYRDEKYQVTSIGENAFMYSADMTSVTIPNTVTTISDRAFDSCTGLTSITLPNSVKSIGAGAFSYCTGLTLVNLPQSVQSIDPTAFSICHNLYYINVDAKNEYYFSESGMLLTKDKELLVIYPKGLRAFRFIPRGVKVIGKGAFTSCKVILVSLPDTVTTIEDGAFFNSLIRSVTIPSSVTKVGDGIFTLCSSLEDIRMLGTNPPECNERVFDEATFNCTLHVPKGSRAAYKAAKGWGEFASIVEFDSYSVIRNF